MSLREPGSHEAPSKQVGPPPRSGVVTFVMILNYVFGLFKVAVIVQQLYHRYVTGKTSDPRFATLIDGVRALTGLGWQAVQKRRIEDLF